MRINKKLIKSPTGQKSISNISINDRFITCDFDGRFANNLFQIGTVISFAYRNQFDCVFPNWSYSNIFDWSLKFDENKRNFFSWKNYRERSLTYKNIPLEGPMKISGWFQSWKYLEQSLIANTFLFKEDIVSKIKNKYSQYLSNVITSVHIRRQDYVGNSKYYQVPISYYNNSIKLLDHETNYFFIFSDDIEWCKNNINNSKVIYIENNLDYEDFILISLCQNNIIANSTFSWWGAYLNKNNKKVVAPCKWYNNEGVYSKQDMYCNDWIIGDEQ